MSELNNYCFDKASELWKANKIRKNNGTYKYKCKTITCKNQQYFLKKTDKEYQDMIYSPYCKTCRNNNNNNKPIRNLRQNLRSKSKAKPNK